MRLIDIEPYESGKDLDQCQVEQWRSGNGYCKVTSTPTKIIPTIDAEPVIRCKDCKNMFEKGWCSLHNTPMNKYDFCSYAEPKARGE